MIEQIGEGKFKRVASKIRYKYQHSTHNHTFLLFKSVQIFVFLLFLHMCQCQQITTLKSFKPTMAPDIKNSFSNSSISYVKTTTLQTTPNLASSPRDLIGISSQVKKKKSGNPGEKTQQLRSNVSNNSYGNRNANKQHEVRKNYGREKIHMSKSKFMDAEDKQKLLHLVMDGLGLKQLPNIKNINISQTEYVSKYNEYMQRIQDRKKREMFLNHAEYITNESHELQIISFQSYNMSYNSHVEQHKERSKRDFRKHFKKSDGVKVEAVQNEKTTIFLHFSKNSEDIEEKSIKTEDVEEANLMLLLIYNPSLIRKQQTTKMRKYCNITAGKRNNFRKHDLNIKIYQRFINGKRALLDRKKIDISFNRTNWDNTHSRWIQFDVTRAVQNWLRETELNLDLELQCDKCPRTGARLLDMSSNNEDRLTPVINIITRPGQKTTFKNDILSEGAFRKENSVNSNSTVTGSCNLNKSKNPRCCRHSMQVVFSQIKGFEFIIQPKTFDAGYCFGRCPIRYNPAHHHAMLQSLIWKQSNGVEAPRLCCAPSKLVELEVLHLDEKDSDKLKISTWTDMRVVECACS